MTAHKTYGKGPTFLEPQPFNVDLSAPETDRLYPRPRRQFVARAGVPHVPQEITPDRDLYPPRGRGVIAQGVPRRVARG